jgi:lysophospholipid acyltransferase (LPLAT)-like uncharacterized protein
MLKRFLRRPAMQELAAALLAFYIRLVYWTSRFEIEGSEHLTPLTDAGKPFLACFWHGRLMMMAYAWRRPERMHLLVSPHADGLLIARTMRRFRTEAMMGSSSRGGAAGLRALIQAGRAGRHLVITPDGPQGPRMRAKSGAVAAARAAALPIVPATYAVSRRKVLGSWDRFIIALPFSRGVILIGAPIDAAAGEPDSVRLALEERLNHLCEQADRRVGVEPILPAGRDEKRRPHRERGEQREEFVSPRRVG